MCGETSLSSASLEIFAYIVLTFNKEHITIEFKLISALKRSYCFLLLVVMCRLEPSLGLNYVSLLFSTS